ncbi:sugar phosphate isomerase/epimerase family protein [Rubrobacter aplysinae]|uniref:sugar phosphate isomerase/epimerase family protein n=1 Tax=Rubrobacter aplysinae TaxID=909625 RepID=UPI000ABBBCA7|nr:sugar phosphate isomerase/epimerase family protein [Rubrobacter aplysinae]
MSLSGPPSSSSSQESPPGLRYAYNTNGAQNHRLEDALDLISGSGYDGVALTLDHHHLDPFAPGLVRRADRLSSRLSRLGLGVVVETGARFLLDPRRKHEPTLVTPDPDARGLRLDFLYRALEVGAATGAEAVSFWSGVPWPGDDPGEAWRRLAEGVGLVLERASELGVTAAFEPEPGMLVETPDGYARLAGEIEKLSGGVSESLSLALDTGHCLVTGEREPEEAVREFAGSLGTVSIEDMPRGVHEHRPFGEGDMDVPAVLGALRKVGFGRLVCVELSRESHRAHEEIPGSLAALREAETRVEYGSGGLEFR